MNAHHEDGRDDPTREHDGGDIGGNFGLGAGRVWLCAQRSPLAQRRGLLVPESVAHPARMLPDLAAHAIATYSAPGEVVLDPMCGIGTSMVQAVRAGRRAVGVELEPRWVRVAEENLALARADGYTADAQVLRGDARALSELLTARPSSDADGDPSDDVDEGGDGDPGRGWCGVDAPSLVLTSPPYGAGVHGQVRASRARGPVVKHSHRYAPTRTAANLAHTPGRLGAGMTEILRAAARVLRPGGHVVIVSRPWRQRGVLIDLPGQMIDCATAAGLVLTDRAVALLARLHDPDGAIRTDAHADDSRADDSQRTDRPSGAQLVVRASFFARHNLHRDRAAGKPVHLIAHEDIAVFTKPITPITARPSRPARPTPPTPPTGPDRATRPGARGARGVAAAGLRWPR